MHFDTAWNSFLLTEARAGMRGKFVIDWPAFKSHPSTSQRCPRAQNQKYWLRMDEKNQANPPQRYRWPWFVLGAFVLAIVLAVFWMSVLVHRVREQRDYNVYPAPRQPAPQTNSVAPKVSVDPVKEQRMAEFRDTLAGGNAEAGRKVFFESPAASCGKCHKAGGQGGDNGPVLDGIAARQSREFILESILFPNAAINTNFQTIVVQLKDNRGLSGTFGRETETNLVLITPEDGPVSVQKSEIARRWIGASPMPENIWQSLSRQDLRDVIEFVAGLPAK
jgi:putative heme-binding domain-containing protein